MSNAWEIFRELLAVMGDIDSLVEKKAKAGTPEEDLLLEQQINIKEIKMYELKNLLKSKEI